VVGALVAAASCVENLPAGPTHRYREGSASVSVAAGVEKDAFELDELRDGSYMENRTLRFTLSGPKGSLVLEVHRVHGRAEYGGPNVSVTLGFEGRVVGSTQGGACSALVRRAEAEGAEGSLSCVGLGTHTGKGYDVGARFTLRA
jgi:hypothetical protein